jgi:hypothetical protein
MHPLRTWALIADGGRARIIQNSGPLHGEPGHGQTAHGWATVEGMVFHGDHETADAGVAAGHGHGFGPEGAGKPSVDARLEPQKSLKTAFAHHLARMLDTALSKGAYHRLIIAAPPHVLGDLRSAISDKVRATLIGEFHHDLTKTGDAEIGSHLQPIRLG